MFFFRKKITIITHNGTFHADDVFAVATLKLFLKSPVRIVRTRNLGAGLPPGDRLPLSAYVVDVGGKYDPAQGYFDHHQQDGAGKRANGVSFASFGLIWKSFGAEVCQSKEVAESIDRFLVQPIDLIDNGEADEKPIFADIYPYGVSSVISSFNNQDTKDEKKQLKRFQEAVTIAQGILERRIESTKSESQDRKFVEEAYLRAQDRRLIIFDAEYFWLPTMLKYPEPIFVVEPSGTDWKVKTIHQNFYSFKSRKDLPFSWAGKRDQELQKITGVDDAIFCHNKRFIAGAKSKEGALKLAHLALLV